MITIAYVLSSVLTYVVEKKETICVCGDIFSASTIYGYYIV